MSYDRPLYRPSPPSLLEGYSTRILIGLLGSLASVLLVLHFPLPDETGRVGWSAHPSEQILLSQVQPEEKEKTSAQKTSADRTGEDRTGEDRTGKEQGAPPPTRHAVPTVEPTPVSPTGSADRSTTKKDASHQEADESQRIRSAATLSAKDRRPEIVGGRSSLYLQIKYPKAAREKEIEGRLLLHFTVSKNGEARNINVTNSLHPLCDSAAVRALRSITFYPAVHDGNPIPIRMSLPIKFQLRSTPSGAEEALRTNRLRSSGN
jgi:TonB family protein